MPSTATVRSTTTTGGTTTVHDARDEHDAQPPGPAADTLPANNSTAANAANNLPRMIPSLLFDDDPNFQRHYDAAVRVFLGFA